MEISNKRSIDRFITDCEEADDTFNFLFENNSLFE
jgi:hypothetical protein